MTADGRGATVRLLATSLLAALLSSAAAAVDGPPAVWGTPVGGADAGRQSLQADLGRHLFFDPKLSRNGCYSCASCHRPELAFSDGLPTAVGLTGKRHRRNTPTLTNVAYNASFTWIDAGIQTLESQAEVPLLNRDPPELGWETTAQLVEKLAGDTGYAARFERAFPAESQPVTLATITSALAAFQRTLVSHDSAFDRYVYRGDHDALSPAAKRGMQVFFSRRLGCVQCHNSWNFSGPVRTVQNPSVQAALHDTGLPGDSNAGPFKVPTLRNVAVTAPYMHDGSLDTLEDVIRHYESGGSASPAKSPLIRSFALADEERADLIVFLEHLSDRSFIDRAIAADPKPERVLPQSCADPVYTQSAVARGLPMH